MPVTGQLAPGVLLAGKYRIERELGAGGMGAVFLAENVDLGRRVAIKVLHPQAAANPEVLARFRQEARAAAAIGHPGIVDVLDLGRTEDGGEFIVMEHLRGESLGQRLSRQAPLPVGEVVRVLDALADALAAAHEHGIVHRDLKPDNVFLVAEPVPAVKIVDFGISKLTQGPERGVRTATGAVLGTPMYMSPEQVNADRELGPAADLYALGAIGYQMLGGRPPFESGSWAHLLLQIINDSPMPLEKLRPHLPAALSELVMQLLAKVPAERPGSAQEVRRRLAALDLSAGEAALAETVAPEALAETAAPEALAETAAPEAVADTVQPAAPAAAAVPQRSRWRGLVLGLAAAAVLVGAPVLYLALRSPAVAPVTASPDSAVLRDAAVVPDVTIDTRAPVDTVDRPDTRRRSVRPRVPARPRTKTKTRPADPLAPLPNVLREDSARSR